MHQSSSTKPPARLSHQDALARLTALSRELAGAYRPATVIDRLVAAVTELLAPDRLTILALDVDTNRLQIAYHRGGERPHIDDP
ncbi:MAG TPA: hypothetical protein VKB45_19715, partial [Gemmatimonadales bacterium]|nr:hypothetical protein [Gemmatimonadales bacterium]